MVSQNISSIFKIVQTVNFLQQKWTSLVLNYIVAPALLGTIKKPHEYTCNFEVQFWTERKWRRRRGCDDITDRAARGIKT